MFCLNVSRELQGRASHHKRNRALRVSRVVGRINTDGLIYREKVSPFCP